jgi:hypothetical protein
MSNTHTSARLHEHAGRIALHFEGVPTIYIDHRLAVNLAEDLTIAAAQVRNGYHYPTTDIKGA